MSQPASIIGAHPFLRGLSPEQVACLAAMTDHISVPAGHRLFSEGGTAGKFWLIDAGQVAIDVLVPGDARMTIEQLGRGDVVGLSWLQPPYQWCYGAVCTQPMQAFEFDARAVRAACHDDPALGYALLDRLTAVICRRLQATRKRLLDARSAPSRL